MSGYGSLSHQDIDDLLWNKLPEWMNDQQKQSFFLKSFPTVAFGFSLLLYALIF
jgi:hypothetical protein